MRAPIVLLGLVILGAGAVFVLIDMGNEPATPPPMSGDGADPPPQARSSEPSLLTPPAPAGGAGVGSEVTAAVVPNVRAGGDPDLPEPVLIEVEPPPTAAELEQAELAERAARNQPAEHPRRSRERQHDVDRDAAEAPDDPAVELRESIREGFQDARDKLSECYEDLLADYPELAERLVFELEVEVPEDAGDDLGLVELLSVSSETLVLDEVECFATALDSIELPAPLDDQPYTVRYPVVLRPE